MLGCEKEAQENLHEAPPYVQDPRNHQHHDYQHLHLFRRNGQPLFKGEAQALLEV
jgi:hypothetical protein